jgi:putative ABC transport system permease protein
MEKEDSSEISSVIPKLEAEILGLWHSNFVDETIPSRMSDAQQQEGVIHVSFAHVLIASIPLWMIAGFSYHVGLGLEKSFVEGTIRSAVQLTVSGYVLMPIFRYGTQDQGYYLVFLYILFMTLLASWETSKRSKYYFDGMFGCILAAFLLNIAWVSFFAFGLILQPKPIWNPQYVIPIAGMLLGNCINGVTLSMNHALVSLKEKNAEIELWLSFGANLNEASAGILRESVRVGTMPILNSMMVIGLISIPGMMTGQILGGSPVIEAARYQIIIMYLIAACAFGTILCEIWVAKQVGFDVQKQRLRADRLKLMGDPSLHQERWFCNHSTLEFFQHGIEKLVRLLFCCWLGRHNNTKNGPPELSLLLDREEAYSPSSPMEYGCIESNNNKTGIELRRMRSFGAIHTDTPLLELMHVSRDIFVNQSNKFLFRDICLRIFPGDLFAVSGPSGTGKTELLRVITGLSPATDDDVTDILVDGLSQKEFTNQAEWRRQVRYVSQYRIDIVGTPRQFVKQITTFESWKKPSLNRADAPPSYDEMIIAASQLIVAWGLPEGHLDKEWKQLSGGESSRVFFAIAMASKPRVLCCDESTASLDSVSKQQLEQSIMNVLSDGVGVLWISHDAEQLERMSLHPELCS